MEDDVPDAQTNWKPTSTTGPIMAIIFLVVLAGLALDERPSMAGVERSSTNEANWFHETAFLGGVDHRVESGRFQGGEATAFMGGVKLDLTKATFDRDEVVLDLTTVMGGVHLRVPEDCAVISHVETVMGGFKDKTRHPVNPSKRLVLKGTVLMGGVQITN
jgi:predicted membrane protein